MRIKLFGLLIIISLLFSGCVEEQEDILTRNLERLQESNPYLRRQATAALGALGNEQVILPIAGMLSDDDIEVIEQAELELGKLWELGLPVGRIVLQEIMNATKEWKSGVVTYLIKTDILGTAWEGELWEVLCEVDEITPYRELLVYLNTKNGPTFFNKLIEMLEGDNQIIAAEVMLVLDTAGYRPSVVLINNLTDQGSGLNDTNGQLLGRYASRGSALIGNNPYAQLRIRTEGGRVIVEDSSAESQARCAEGDALWLSTSSKLHWAMRLALLQGYETPASVKTVYEGLWESDKEALYTLYQDQLNAFSADSLIQQAIIRFMAGDEAIRQHIRTLIDPIPAIEIWFDDGEPDLANYSSKRVLVVDHSREIYDHYHWSLPMDLRIQQTDDVRFLIIISEENKIITLTDMMLKEQLLEVEFNEMSEIDAIFRQALSLLNVE